jgi:hypothetical protein
MERIDIQLLPFRLFITCCFHLDAAKASQGRIQRDAKAEHHLPWYRETKPSMTKLQARVQDEQIGVAEGFLCFNCTAAVPYTSDHPLLFLSPFKPLKARSFSLD